MKLYLIRHGETDVNRVLNHGVISQIHTDPILFKEGESTNVPLNINGRNQAEEIGTLLPDHIDTIYSSPLLRVKETAEIIARAKGIDASGIIFSNKLVEYNMGSLEGLSLNKKIEIAGGKVWGSSLQCTYDYTKWGGDSWKTIRLAFPLFSHIIKVYPHERDPKGASALGALLFFLLYFNYEKRTAYKYRINEGKSRTNSKFHKRLTRKSQKRYIPSRGKNWG